MAAELRRGQEEVMEWRTTSDLRFARPSDPEAQQRPFAAMGCTVGKDGRLAAGRLRQTVLAAAAVRNLVRKGNRTRMLLAASIFVAFAQGALAKELDCRAMESTRERLACYDAAFPPRLKKPAMANDAASRDGYVDPLVTEDARTAAKLKNICRGC